MELAYRPVFNETQGAFNGTHASGYTQGGAFNETQGGASGYTHVPASNETHTKESKYTSSNKSKESAFGGLAFLDLGN